MLCHPSSVPLDPGADSRGAGRVVNGHQCPQFFLRKSYMLEIPSFSILGSVWFYVRLFSEYSLHYVVCLFFSSQLLSFVVSIISELV